MLERLLGGVGKDQVKAVVDHRLFGCAARVIRNDLRNAVAPVLRGERDDRGRAAECRRHGSRIKIVGTHHPHAGKLFDMAMAVDAAGQYPLAGRVHVLAARRQSTGKRDDASVSHSNVRLERRVRGRYPAVADRQVKLRAVFRHLLLPIG